MRRDTIKHKILLGIGRIRCICTHNSRPKAMVRPPSRLRRRCRLVESSGYRIVNAVAVVAVVAIPPLAHTTFPAPAPALALPPRPRNHNRTNPPHSRSHSHSHTHSPKAKGQRSTKQTQKKQRLRSTVSPQQEERQTQTQTADTIYNSQPIKTST